MFHAVYLKIIGSVNIFDQKIIIFEESKEKLIK